MNLSDDPEVLERQLRDIGQCEAVHISGMRYAMVTLAESKQHPSFWDVYTVADGASTRGNRPMRPMAIPIAVEMATGFPLGSFFFKPSRCSPTAQAIKEAEARAPRVPRVYFVQAECGGPIKIGHSVDVEKRVLELQTGNPYRLVVLASKLGDVLDEQALHRKLSKWRLVGEWFENSDDVMAEVELALNADEPRCARASRSKD